MVTPDVADFGLWGQLYNAHRDPTPREIIEIRAPNTLAWIERMSDPTALGEFESWTTLSATLTPLLQDQVAGLFLPWSKANARAIADGSDSFSVKLRSGMWQQRPQKYHARSLQALQKHYQSVSNQPAIVQLMQETGCLDYLV